MVWEYIKLMVFRLLENEYESQKIESRDFYSRSLKAKLSTGSYYELSQAEGNYLLPQSLSPLITSGREKTVKCQVLLNIYDYNALFSYCGCCP